MDCTFVTNEGKFNFRVGAIIQNGNKVLMARNPKYSSFYSVGGRVMLNETLENAVLREVKEETSVSTEIDRMGFIHECFFTNEEGQHYHEISIYFYIKVTDELLKIKNGHLTNEGPDGEYLQWIELDKEHDFKVFPEFFKEELLNCSDNIKHIVTIDK